MLRHSSLFQFRHGSHACVFYRSEDALMEVLTPYIAEGLRKGERCFCAQKPNVIKRLMFDLRFIGVDIDAEVDGGNLELHTEDEVYFPNNAFEPEALIERLESSIRDSIRRGNSGFRSAGELSWVVEGRSECDRMIEYERMVEEAFPRHPAVGICQYDMGKFEPEVLASVLEAHRFHVFGSQANSNHSSLRFGYGECTAEIVVDRFVLNPAYYYVVQQRFPQEVVGWGKAPDFDTAAECAQQLARSSS